VTTTGIERKKKPSVEAANFAINPLCPFITWQNAFSIVSVLEIDCFPLESRFKAAST
jgi:hypothetical protein